LAEFGGTGIETLFERGGLLCIAKRGGTRKSVRLSNVDLRRLGVLGGLGRLLRVRQALGCDGGAADCGDGANDWNCRNLIISDL
jgi:hypothetical protein